MPGKNPIYVHVDPAAECGCEGQADASLEVSVLTFGAEYAVFKKCTFTIKGHNGGRGSLQRNNLIGFPNVQNTHRQ